MRKIAVKADVPTRAGAAVRKAEEEPAAFNGKFLRFGWLYL
jgi:hypothetical protein